VAVDAIPPGQTLDASLDRLRRATEQQQATPATAMSFLLGVIRDVKLDMADNVRLRLSLTVISDCANVATQILATAQTSEALPAPPARPRAVASRKDRTAEKRKAREA